MARSSTGDAHEQHQEREGAVEHRATQRAGPRVAGTGQVDERHVAVRLEVDAGAGDVDDVRRHEQVDVAILERPRELAHAVVAEVLGVGDDDGVDGIDVEGLARGRSPCPSPERRRR